MSNPLWLPAGSIRAIITLAVVGMFMYLTYNNMIHQDVFVNIASMVIAFYFGKKEERGKRKEDKD